MVVLSVFWGVKHLTLEWVASQFSIPLGLEHMWNLKNKSNTQKWEEGENCRAIELESYLNLDQCLLLYNLGCFESSFFSYSLKDFKWYRNLLPFLIFLSVFSYLATKLRVFNFFFPCFYLLNGKILQKSIPAI